MHTRNVRRNRRTLPAHKAVLADVLRAPELGRWDAGEWKASSFGPTWDSYVVGGQPWALPVDAAELTGH